MASGSVGADGDRDLTEDLHPKNEVSIVYTRKNRRKAPGNSNSEAAEQSVGVESARAEPTSGTSPSRSRLSNDEVVLRPVSEGIQVGQDGNFTEEADSKNECLTHDASRGPEEIRDGNEALTDPGAEPRLLGAVEVREELQVSACEIVQPVLQPTVGEEPFLDGRPEFLSDSGKEIDANNQKVANGGRQSVGNGSEDQLFDSRTERLNNGKELQPISGQSDHGDDSILPNGREEPLLSCRQATMAIGGVGHPNGVAPVISRNGMLKPVICRVADRVRVALSETNSKVELRGLKRKFENELDQVRNVAKRLKAKELQIGSFNSGNTTSRSTYISNSAGNLGFYNQPQLIRVNSVVGSGGHPETRPFRYLNVSVMENSHGAGEFAEKEKRTPKANKFYRNSEFLLGDDRLSQESNKKLKANGAGKKHGIAVENGFGFGFGADKNMDKVFKSCSNLLQRLMKHKHGWVFNSPVDAEKLDLPDYHDIIKQPMDFGTIKDRLSQNLYRSTRQFAEDVRLVFCNAMTYNPKGQDVHSMAEELSEIFEDKWASIEKEYIPYHMYYDAGLPTPNPPRRTHPLPPSMPAPLSIPTPSRSAPPMRTLDRSESVTMPSSTRPRPGNVDTPHAGRTPVPKKPKAKDPHKRDMTYEEKQKLGTNLQSLPSEKLDAVVQIINRRNSGLSQHNDEIEVDIDSVDAETLWELDRFVTNYKKSLSKYKRKAELAEKARVAAAKSVLATNPAPPASLDSQTEGPPGGNINPALVQVGIQGDNASPSSSSSSSSSSDSGSTSTGNACGIEIQYLGPDMQLLLKETEEKEPEAEEMTLEEYEKVLEEKRKALQSLKTEERKVDDKAFASMQPLANKKKNSDDIFIKLGSDKDKKKELAEKEEKAKKALSINEFLKPAEGERYYSPSGGGRGGRGRGGRGGGSGGGGGRGYGGGGNSTSNVEAAPSIEDPGQFPTLGAK